MQTTTRFFQPIRWHVLALIFAVRYCIIETLVKSNALLSLLGKHLSRYPARPMGLASEVIPRRNRITFNWLFMIRALVGRNRLFAGAASTICDGIEASLRAGKVPMPEVRTLDRLELADSDPETFRSEYIRNPRPVVVRGFDVSALRDWSPDWFIRTYGDTPVLLTDKKRNFQAPLKLLGESTDRDLYLHNSENLLLKHNELFESLNVDQFSPWIGRKYWSSQIFIGASKGTGALFHCANNYNVFMNIFGKKKWTIVSPEDTYFMYPHISASMGYFSSALYSAHKGLHLDQFPLYPYATRFEVVLEPGDILFNPPWWWHSVENITEGSVAVATRWDIRHDTSTNILLAAAQGLSPRFFGSVRRAIFNLQSARSVSGRPMEDDNKTSFERYSHTKESLADSTLYTHPELAWGRHFKAVTVPQEEKGRLA